MTRDEYTAQARQRRSEATEMRRAGLSLRAIAEALRCSLGEIHRLLKAYVQGPPGLSDFKSAGFMGSVTTEATKCDERSECKLVLMDEGFVFPVSAGNGGAIAAAIVSEYAASADSAHSAQHESDMTGDGRGVRGETVVGESPIAYIQRRIREIVAKMRAF